VATGRPPGSYRVTAVNTFSACRYMQRVSGDTFVFIEMVSCILAEMRVEEQLPGGYQAATGQLPGDYRQHIQRVSGDTFLFIEMMSRMLAGMRV
jgi:hypothetical protein